MRHFGGKIMKLRNKHDSNNLSHLEETIGAPEHEEHNHSKVHNHSHSHYHKGYDNLNIFQFSIVLLLNLGITVAEFVGGLLSGSLSLISDSAHNLSDSLSLVISYAAQRISKRSINEKKTFGYKRANIIAALFNSSTLVIIGGWLIFEAVERLIRPNVIKIEIVLYIATIGLVANFVSMLVLRKWTEKNLNLSSAYLHMLMDALSSVTVIIGVIIIRFFNITFVDPLITILIAVYVIKEAFEILNHSVSILMQGVPKEINMESIIEHMASHPDIADVHHIHLWNLDEQNVFLEAHVNLKEDVRISDSMMIYKTIFSELENMGINHVTIQFEYKGCKNSGTFGCR